MFIVLSFFNTSPMMSQLMTVNDVSNQFDESLNRVILLRRIDPVFKVLKLLPLESVSVIL